MQEGLCLTYSKEPMKAHVGLSLNIARRRAGPARLGGTVPQIISTTPSPFLTFSTTRMTDGRLMSRPMTERRMPRRESVMFCVLFDATFSSMTPLKLDELLALSGPGAKPTYLPIKTHPVAIQTISISRLVERYHESCYLSFPDHTRQNHATPAPQHRQRTLSAPS